MLGKATVNQKITAVRKEDLGLDIEPQRYLCGLFYV